jgi:hypothetical protein
VFSNSPLIRRKDGTRAEWVGWKDLKAAGFPGKDSLEGRFGRDARRFGIDDFAVLNPDFPLHHSVGDLQHGGALRQALQLNDVDKALALDAAESTLRFARQEGFNRLHEQPHSPGPIPA